MNIDFWDKVLDGLDEKLVNETAETMSKKQYDDIQLTEIVVEKPTPKRFNIGALIGIAAVAVLIVGAVFIAGAIKNSDIQIAEKPPYSNTTEYEKIRVYKGRKYDRLVDIYSVGLVMYRYLNNNVLPFLPQSARSQLRKKP